MYILKKELKLNKRQRTIKQDVSFSGIGLHSGRTVQVTVHPSVENTGIVFRRVNLPNQPIIPATIMNRYERMRCTGLAVGASDVFTVEHFLAACTALKLDNLMVDIDWAEFPGMDGSALPFFEKLQSAGIEQQDAEAKILTVEKPFVLEEKNAKIEVFPSPGQLHLEYYLDYHVSYIPQQHVDVIITEETFEKEIAGARTFALKSEVDAVLNMGLGKGANDQNTLVICEDGLPYNNTLRFSDEYARHRLLDLLGDISLVGCRIEGHFIGYGSGHSLNGKLTRQLLALQ